MKLDKFTMVKMINPFLNKDQLLWIGEIISS
jgi:hypothetical protein